MEKHSLNQNNAPMTLKNSLTKELIFNDTKPIITVLLTTTTSKEIRIVMKKNQSIKEHQAPYPITVEVFEGEIIFGVQGKKHQLQKGDIIALEANIPHDLYSQKDTIIRLTLSKKDTEQRVKQML